MAEVAKEARERRLRALLAALSGVAVVLGTMAIGGAVAIAFETADTVPAGVTVEGVAVGGLEEEAAAAAIREAFALQSSPELVARFGERRYPLVADGLVSVDATGLARDAVRLRSGRSALEQLSWLWDESGLGVDIPLRRSVDDAAIWVWARAIASEIDTPAVDASRTVSPDGFAFVAASPGTLLDRAKAASRAREVLLAGGGSFELPVAHVEPLIGEEDLGLAIHVDLSERRLYLYEGAVLVERYGVAIGAPGFSTPRGSWHIVNKRYMPTWGNPGSAWAASMPRTIPPGPSNPLGTRALDLNISGIRIHGTSKDGSIGTAASHGCMRMHRWDIEELYDLVGVGTPVYITS